MTINSTSSQLIGPNNVRKQNNKVNHSDNLSISPNQPSTPIVLTVAMSSSTTVSPSIFSVRHNQSRLFTLNNGSSNFFGINDRDIPILIGAAAGAIGLIIIILAAILAWYCCQYGIRRQKSSYRLDEENEKWASCSNFGSGVFADNDSVIFTGIENIPNQCVKGHNIRRSLSTQIHLVNLNFTKKRANRMRNDSAAAIALNRSGATPTHSPYLTKETDCLVDNDSLIANEAVVVYDERTVL
uniref:Uncharacterized protein n=1 Tax=Tetranychus urticae TaxID=32264 RepID=T1KI81_TETUR